MKKFLWETRFAKTFDYSSTFKSIVKYLVQNRSIVLSHQELQPIYQLKPYSKTIINELFERCVNTGYIQEFASIYPIIQKTDNSLPEGLTGTDIVYDLKNNRNSYPLSTYQELNNKLLINIAGLVKRNEQTKILTVSDVNELHSMYIRSMLVRSFSTSDSWLTPNLITYITKVYSLSLAGMVGKYENLSFQEQITVAMVFALYMSQQFARNDDNPAKPRNFFKCTFLGSISDLENMAARGAEKASEGLTLENVAELISETGPQRLQKFNISSLYTMGKQLGSALDAIPTYIALEYAPYFTFMVLNVLSGGKGGSLQLRMKENKLDGTAGKQFINEFKVCQSLYLNK